MTNGEKGGMFNVAKGAQQESGEARIFSALIAGDCIADTVNGMSRFGLKIHAVTEGAEFAGHSWPVVEQYMEHIHEY